MKRMNSQRCERLSHATHTMDVEIQKIEDVTPDVSRMVAISGSSQVTLFATLGHAAVPPPCGARILLTLRLRPPQRLPGPRRVAIR